MPFRKILQILLASVLAMAVLVPAASAHPHRRHARQHARRHHRHRPAAATVANCTDADATVTTASHDQLRAAVDCLVNVERTRRGLPAMNPDSRLDRSAQLWTNVIVNTGVFSHGSNFAARITAVGFIWGFAGENIATGFDTPRKVVAGWMASPDHCHNILDPHFTDEGTGVDEQPFGGYGAGTWTQDFALPLGHHAPSGNTGPQSGCPY